MAKLERRTLRAPESALLMEDDFCDEVMPEFGSVPHARGKSFHAVRWTVRFFGLESGDGIDILIVLQVMQENPMRTTIVLDDNLIKTAQKYTGLMGKSAPMREALKALIEREAAWRLAELGGTAPAHCRRGTHRPAPRPSPPIPPAWADSRARLHRCAAPVACGSR